MTDGPARALANLAIVGVGAVTAYHVIRTPPLRRVAWRMLKYGILMGLPQYLWQETRRAWDESDPKRRAPEIMAG